MNWKNAYHKSIKCVIGIYVQTISIIEIDKIEIEEIE